MIVYGYESAGPGAGLFIYRDVEELLDALREEIEANNLFAGEIELTVKVLDMTEEELAALPTNDDL